MNKNIIVLLQIVLSCTSLFFAYGGKITPSLPLWGAVGLCLLFVMVSWACLKRRFFVFAAIVIAAHLALVLSLPLTVD
jgi:hypothetical protein